MAQLIRSASPAGSRLRFDGQVAVVTGAGGNPGLGRSYAMLLASLGARVVVNDVGVGPDGRGRDVARADEVVDEIRALGGEAVANAQGVDSRDGARNIVETAIDAFGHLDIVINNAGIAPFATFEELTDAEVEAIVGVHLMGHIWMARAAWPQFTARGYGRLVNVSSSVAARGMVYQSVYGAAKLGVVGLTRGLAAEGLARGIAVNAIMPAADTQAWRTTLEPGFSERARADGMNADVVAPVAAYLAHRDCTFSGKIIETRAGAMNELFFARSKGSGPDPDLQLDGVAATIGTILDRAGATDLPDPDGIVPDGLVPLRRVQGGTS